LKTRKRKRADGEGGPRGALRAEWRVNLVDCDPLQTERVRASFSGSPFRLLPTADTLPPSSVDLYVVPATSLGDLPERGVPVIARGPAALVRAALLAGCMDYLREPWTAEECAARVQAAVSRVEPRWTLPWARARLEGCRVVGPGCEVRLTWHETQVLRALLRSRGSPVPRAVLGYAVGAGAARAGSRALDAHVSAVRRKLRSIAPAGAEPIVCVRGQGYMIP
jgi:hypothetical protein